MTNEFEGWEEFFASVGDRYLHPKQYGECLWPITIEQMYRMFKARMAHEAALDTEDQS